MTVFIIIVTIVILQRLGELVIARKNERWMKAKGAMEYGEEHYRYIVIMHSLFFVSLILEVIFFEKGLSPQWPLLLSLFLLTQGLRIWSLLSLGRFWNTKIIILPKAKVIKKGPYKYIKHPNYAVVAI
jgi:methyltransferase